MKYAIFILLIAIALFAETADRIVPTYAFKKNVAEMTYLIEVKNDDSTILDVLFEPKHILKYAGRTNLVIKPISEKNNRNILEYNYNYLVAKLLVEMKRERFPELNKITFSMIRYNKTSPVIPQVLSIEGSYQIIEKNGQKFIKYHQQTVMKEDINKVYQMLMKRDVRRFIRETIAYLDATSKSSLAERQK